LGHLNSTNIYKEDEEKIRRKNLFFYLKKMEGKPSCLFVGLAPGRLGCFQTGITFTDTSTFFRNSFFQKRRNEKSIIDLWEQYKKGKTEELVSSIAGFYSEEKSKINEIKKKKKLQRLIIDFIKKKEEFKKETKEEIERRIELACLIINSLKEEKEVGKEEIAERIKLVYLIADFCTKDGVKVDRISEQTSSTVWERLNKLCEIKLCEINMELPLLWNIYPFYPWKYGENNKNKINRTPTGEECGKGVEFLNDLLDLFPSIKYIYAVGKKSEETLKDAGFQDVTYICHPAAIPGGATRFREKFNEIYQIKDISPKPKNKKKQNNNKNNRKDQNSEDSEE
jgi:uracil-DNA glycosylase